MHSTRKPELKWGARPPRAQFSAGRAVASACRTEASERRPERRLAPPRKTSDAPKSWKYCESLVPQRAAYEGVCSYARGGRAPQLPFSASIHKIAARRTDGGRVNNLLKLIFRLLIALLVFTLPVHGAADSTSPCVLFIGNSYTGVNNLPQIFREVAASAGHAPSKIEAVTPGGMTLYQHLSSPGTLKAIDEGNWDIVVLQAQSQEAAMSGQLPNVRDRFLKGAAGLYDRIKTGNPHARIILYQTWARHADYWNEPKADRSIGNDPTDMQARIRKWHQNAAAQRNDFLIAPVGDAWELNYQNPNAIRLHASDNSHPAFNGSYLAALVIYDTIYDPPDLNVSYHGDLSHAETLYLQTIAAQATHMSFLP